MAAHATPAFPLNSPLLPGMALPLRLFEPRYLTMVADLLAGTDPSFVVSLITRGHEVGGGAGSGEERSPVGCTATIVDAAEHPDRTWSVLAAGTERVRIDRWLDDAPYPRALVEAWPDPPVDDDTDVVDRIDLLELEVLELVALATELGLPRPDLDHDFSGDPTVRVYQFATVCPLGAHDRHRLLCAPDLPGRVELLADLVGEQQLLLGARRDFGRGDGPDG
ncbi:MAG: LON peptidase substrate-binding domain-containing protein [Actinomycetota bacterium]|nr:LON peptidase substrate-binding domain-containing protein [Actinomycetota bacterium]